MFREQIDNARVPMARALFPAGIAKRKLLVPSVERSQRDILQRKEKENRKSRSMAD